MTNERLPFSFQYDGVDSRTFESRLDWRVETSDAVRDVLLRTAEAAIPGTSVLLTWTRMEYLDTPATDWTIRFTNAGRSESGVLSDIRALDLTCGLPDGNRHILLHRLRGSNNRVDDWAPYATEIEPDVPAVSFAPKGGKPSQEACPFFNVEWNGGGLLCAIGWSGQWFATVSRTAGNECAVTAGMQRSRFALRPGEGVRTPRILAMPWSGKEEDSYNAFRRVMLAHVLPRVDGVVPYPPIAHLTTSFDKDPNASGFDDVVSHFEPVAAAGFEVLWLDAYFHKDGFPKGMGNCGFPVDRVVNRETFPDGIRPVSDYAHARGAEFLLWFEPERVYAGTMLETEHPEWLIQNTIKSNRNRLFNLGIPEAREFMTGYLAASIEAFGMDILRIDFNFEPLTFWQSDDLAHGGERREGISEIRYVEGLYRMWDDLRARFPRLRIDNCASGGMRIDLETCSRSYPLWRTDSVIQPLLDGDLDLPAMENQLMSLGLNRYVPFSTSGTMGADPYHFRSGFNAGASFCEDCRGDGYPVGLLKEAIAEGKSIRRYFAGDFYVLTPDAGASPENWCVIQYHLPAEDRGIVLAFRRPEARDEAFGCELRGIDPDADYRVEFSETYGKDGTVRNMRGAELKAVTLRLGSRPSSLLLAYSKAGSE